MIKSFKFFRLKRFDFNCQSSKVEKSLDRAIPRFNAERTKDYMYLSFFETNCASVSIERRLKTRKNLFNCCKKFFYKLLTDTPISALTATVKIFRSNTRDR